MGKLHQEKLLEKGEWNLKLGDVDSEGTELDLPCRNDGGTKMGLGLLDSECDSQQRVAPAWPRRTDQNKWNDREDRVNSIFDNKIRLVFDTNACSV